MIWGIRLGWESRTRVPCLSLAPVEEGWWFGLISGLSTKGIHLCWARAGEDSWLVGRVHLQSSKAGKTVVLRGWSGSKLRWKDRANPYPPRARSADSSSLPTPSASIHHPIVRMFKTNKRVSKFHPRSGRQTALWSKGGISTGGEEELTSS